MIALLDGDILVYRIGFASQEKSPKGEVVALPEGIARARMRDTISLIAETLGLDNYQVFLTSTDKSNFRYQIYPEYKANRKQPKPLHYDLLRDYLVNDQQAVVVTGQEADDSIGIASQELGENCIICSIDKDLDQLPGNHYNFVKNLLYQISPEEGLKFFYHQLLMGDRTDNIPGLSGIGEKRAAMALQKATTERHYFAVARDKYQAEFGENWAGVMRRNGQLLKIRQTPEELWDFPHEEPPDETEQQPIEEVA